jgi:hypothetical protein
VLAFSDVSQNGTGAHRYIKGFFLRFIRVIRVINGVFLRFIRVVRVITHLFSFDGLG